MRRDAEIATFEDMMGSTFYDIRIRPVAGKASWHPKERPLKRARLDKRKRQHLGHVTIHNGANDVVANADVNFERDAAMRNGLFSVALAGSVVAALCCFTPLMPIVLTGLGLTGLIGILYNDAVLLPMLAGFLCLSGYALWRQKKQK